MKRATGSEICAAILLALLVGCGDSGPTRYEVTGRVTFDGQPVPAGRIDFEPDTSQGNTGPAGSADIVDGTYTTASGQGVVGGPHLVRISGRDGQPLTLESGDVDPNGRQLFAEYTEQVDFPAAESSRDFEVPVERP